MLYGFSNAAIAKHLDISRQAVTKHRRRGMPNESLEAASAWYHGNVSVTRRKRGTFSTLPIRVAAFDFDDDAIDAREVRDEASVEPPPLDDFPAGFWGTDATKSILDILSSKKTKIFSKRENTIAAFFCINAGMRLHLRLMPAIMAKRVGARDREAAEDALMEWACQFAAHWFGEDFEKEPILPEGITRLDEFYRPLEGSA